MPERARPAIAVLSTLFPSAAEPVAGLFIRERMFRVARRLPVTIIAPQPWFPLQGWVRRWKPNYRPDRVRLERVGDVEVHRPRFLAFPGIGRRFDGFFIALAVRRLLRRLMAAGRADLLDVHFGYPDGHAGYLLSRWCGLPYTLTLRGKEERLSRQPALRDRIARAVQGATRLIAVSDALLEVGISLGAQRATALRIGNGVDLDRFQPVDRARAREQLSIAQDADVLVSVGGLVERKGFHRVLEVMPGLLERHPKLVFLVVGGPSPEGDWSDRLRSLAQDLGLGDRVRFLGPLQPDALRVPLSAADLFVLATSYEGWANVFLEAMACGQPVVTTLVGGNAEVVCRDELGLLVPFGDAAALREAIHAALARSWDREAIRRYAGENTWDRRIDALCETFARIDASRPTTAA